MNETYTKSLFIHFIRWWFSDCVLCVCIFFYFSSNCVHHLSVTFQNSKQVSPIRFRSLLCNLHQLFILIFFSSFSLFLAHFLFAFDRNTVELFSTLADRFRFHFFRDRYIAIECNLTFMVTLRSTTFQFSINSFTKIRSDTKKTREKVIIDSNSISDRRDTRANRRVGMLTVWSARGNWIQRNR